MDRRQYHHHGPGAGPGHVLGAPPFILLGTIFVFVLYGFGRRLVGDAAALGAVFLYALDPTISYANSGLVTTDFGVAFFLTVYLWALWSYIHRPGLARLLACGLALGAALGAKFSAVAILPVTAVLLFAAALLPPEPDPGNPPPLLPADVVLRRLMQYGLALAGMCVVAFAFLQHIYLLPKNPLQASTGGAW